MANRYIEGYLGISQNSLRFLLEFVLRNEPCVRTVLQRLENYGKIHNCTLSNRLAPSLCISYSTKSDIHVIIMNPSDGGNPTVWQKFWKKPFRLHIIPKTKGLDESLFNKE